MASPYPPGPPTGMFGFTHLKAIREDLVGFGQRLQREFGDVAYYRLGPLDCYQLVHPDHVHEALVKKARHFRKPARLVQVLGRFEGQGLVVSDGDLWARQRRLVQPAFATSALAGYAGVITSLTQAMLAGWSNGVIDFSSQMRAVSLRIVARTLFSTSIDDVLAEVGAAVDVLQSWSMKELNSTIATPTWLPLIGQPAARKAISFIRELIDRIIRERRSRSAPATDLLGRLLGAVDSEGDGQGMSDRQLRDELVTMLLAGHETMAASLTWTGWLLARHGEIQDRLAIEVRELLGGRPAEHADLPGLAGVERLFKESMRLYPAVYFFSREVASPVEVAGYAMKPTSQVFVMPYLTQRDPRWFPDPERFDPDRFLPDREASLPACAWFPFGAGPRLCVGKSLSLMEGTLVLTGILQQVRLRLAPGEAEPELEWQLTLHPRGGLRLLVERR